MSERDLFLALQDIPDAADRAKYLDEHSRGDDGLRSRVEGLLQAHAAAGSFLEPPAADLDRTGAYQTRTPAAPSETVGTVIAGRYTLVDVIGEGGMGTVYLAEQAEPVKRQVALKLIKGGMDSKVVLARFDAERQALALMDHPNIARVYDGGSTASGQPFFVMELVRGVPITQFCDEHRLPVKARLEIFVSVCQAVQHAHQKGIIHRDLKPGNVLVTEVDGRPSPKVIDFGVAKATEIKLTEQSFADTGAIVGTPAYMSPEQAEPSSMDIDTRTDVYALGVILYELLVGSPPIESKQFRRGAFLEMLRMVREVDPPRPSTKLSTADALPSIAASRDIEPARLARLLRGELDWVVMKAIEKDRTRRYATANGFARDIERYLADEVVEARPPSAGYRLRKFVRRHRGQVIAASLLLLALVGGFAGTTWGLLEAREQGARARAAAEREKTRADELKQVSDFQARMLAQVDPTKAGMLLTGDVIAKFEAALVKANIPEAERAAQVEAFRSQWSRVNATDAARELIDRTILQPAVAAIDEQFKEQPAVDAQLRQVLADRYKDLGLFAAALPIQLRTLSIRREVLGSDNPTTAVSINALGMLLREQGKLIEARPLLEESLAMNRRLLGEDDPYTLISLNQLGMLHHNAGRLGEAEPILRDALQRSRRVLGEDHSDTVICINNLAHLLEAQGKLNDAEILFREALEKNRRVRGEEHPHTLISVNQMGYALQTQGKVAEAEAYFLEGLAKSRRVLGEEHPNTVIAIHNMGGLLRAQGRLREAEPYFREALEKNRRNLGEDHPYTLISINQVGILLQEQSRFDEAEPFSREAMARSRRVLSESHPDTLIAIHSMAGLLKSQGKLSEAEPLMREAMEKFRRTLTVQHANTLISISSLAGLKAAQGAHAAVVELLATDEAPARKAFTGGLSRRLGLWLLMLGKARIGLEEFAAAEPNLLEAQAILVPSGNPAREAVLALMDLYNAWHAAEPGKGYDAKAAAWKVKLPRETAPPPRR